MHGWEKISPELTHMSTVINGNWNFGIFHKKSGFFNHSFEQGVDTWSRRLLLRLWLLLLLQLRLRLLLNIHTDWGKSHPAEPITRHESAIRKSITRKSIIRRESAVHESQ